MGEVTGDKISVDKLSPETVLQLPTLQDDKVTLPMMERPVQVVAAKSELDDINYILPEYRSNARRRSQEELDKIKKYHAENAQKFKVVFEVNVTDEQVETKENEN